MLFYTLQVRAQWIRHQHWFTNVHVCIPLINVHTVKCFIYRSYVDVVARSRYLRQGEVIPFHSKLRDVITYLCLRYLLLATKSSYVLIYSLRLDELANLCFYVSYTWLDYAWTHDYLYFALLLVQCMVCDRLGGWKPVFLTFWCLFTDME